MEASRVDWSNWVIPALVAALVALGIEWAAKPRLEARKQRLLERIALREDIEKLLHLANLTHGMLMEFAPSASSSWSREGRRVARSEARRLRSELSTQGLALFEQAARLQVARDDHLLFEVLTSVAGDLHVIGVAGVGKVNTERFQRALAVAIIAIGGGRLPWQRRGDRKVVRSWLEHEYPALDH